MAEERVFMGRVEIIIEAVQCTGDIESQQEIESFVGHELKQGSTPDFLKLEDQEADLLDYFVKDPKGKVYIAKREIFERVIGNKRGK